MLCKQEGVALFQEVCLQNSCKLSWPRHHGSVTARSGGIIEGRWESKCQPGLELGSAFPVMFVPLHSARQDEWRATSGKWRRRLCLCLLLREGDLIKQAIEFSTSQALPLTFTRKDNQLRRKKKSFPRVMASIFILHEQDNICDELELPPRQREGLL